jgi:hypothetical protein
MRIRIGLSKSSTLKLHAMRAGVPTCGADFTRRNQNEVFSRLSPKRKLRLQSLRYLNAVLPYLTPLAWSTLAHAQGTISFNNLTTFMQTVTTACILVGSLAILMGLVFSVFGFIGGNILRGVTGAFGAVLGAGIIGWGPSWVSSLTGQTVGP